MSLDQTEQLLFARPSQVGIEGTWRKFMSDPLLSTTKLRATALSKHGLGETSADGGILLRSVYWRFYFGLLPPPTSLNLFPPSLESSRETYNILRRRYLVAPDGRWAADCSGGEGQPNSKEKGRQVESANEGWDPLSLDGQVGCISVTASPSNDPTGRRANVCSSWMFWDARLSAGDRFPDIPYFLIPRVRVSLTTILFLYSILNLDVGYRQGMHELLAVCFLVVDHDSLLPSNVSSNSSSSSQSSPDLVPAMKATLDRRYVEHDAFELFQAVMKGIKSSYEWRAEEGPRIKNGSGPVAPIITRCNHIHSSLIRRTDPQLWERLEAEGIETQIWAIRWLRLIFTRELPFASALRLWDGIFAEDPSLGLMDHVIVAMLLLIRNELLEADYPTLLTNLLHYPSPSTEYPFSPYLILSQALFLRGNISPSSGVEVVIQNQDLLGIKASGSERNRGEDVDPLERSSARGRGRGRGKGSVRGTTATTGRGGVQGLAQGLFERAQAAGLDKAFMSTVADLRKNLPDTSTAYSYIPNLPFSPLSPPAREAASPFSSIPTAFPRPFVHPTIEPKPRIASRPSIDSLSSEKTIKDAELEIAELRLAMLGMGKAMAEWLDRPDEEASRMGLERIKETLLDVGRETEDLVREWAWHDGLESRSASESGASSPGEASAAVIVTPTAPAVSVMPTTPRASEYNPPRAKPALYLSTRDDKPVAASLPRVPHTAPLPSRPPAVPRVPLSGQVDGNEMAEEKERQHGDPLAGLGVGKVKADEWRKAKGVDPLLGVGI
ncbi:TBC1 domain family member 5, partial [Tremellales sp. Uapishka_1]